MTRRRPARATLLLASVIATSLATALMATPLAAQLPVLDLRVGAHAVVPTADLGDFYDPGFGVYGRVGMPVGPVQLVASATWSRLGGIATAATTDLDIVSGQVGPHFTVAMFDLGAEVAYFSQFQEIGLAPNVSLRLGRFDLTASYNTTFKEPTGSWLTVGAGLRF